MKQNTHINRLRLIVQSGMGITKSEATILFLLVFGGICGFVLRYVAERTMLSMPVDQGLQQTTRIIDSLMLIEQTSYTGIADDGNAIAELAKGDTTFKPQKAFPIGKKKSLQMGKKINLNTAAKTEIMQLPGIGESTAEKILAYRKQQSFKSIEDIMNVKGIGEKKFEKMKPYLSVQSAKN